MQWKSTETVTDKDRAYRRRLAADGRHQLVVALPHAMVALIDDIQRRHGLKNRSAALVRLLEQGGEIAQH
jgi:hypothetical protein